ncbi:response regulator [Sulfurovum sp. CS9]|uniref:response regulator n=1 Tax=Sulfurovum sp. CS9 TaxID=3391146 RepID=UPI0039E8A69D
MNKSIWVFLLGSISYLSADMLVDVKEVEEFWIWIALFALGLIGITILFLSSRHIMKVQKLHKEMFDKQLEMEHSQSVFLASMSENIHDIVEQRFAGTSDQVHHSLAEESVQEHRLLDVTNDLIEFLRLKSKKVEIINEKFNLNNVLNEVSGSICSAYKGSNVELIFDIDNNIPRYLIGDSLNLEKVLNNFLEYTMNQFYKVEAKLEIEVKLEITMFDTYNEKLELQFKLIDTGRGVDTETLETLFEPHYDEKSNVYTGLGLFVAKELISEMHGEMAVQSIEGKGTTFTLALPFSMVDAGNKRNYRLPEKVLTTKKVFIVDSNYNSALAIKKMFSYFKHDIKVVTKEEFIKNMYNLTRYDIVILDETLLNIRTVDYLSRIKKEKELKVVGLTSLLQENENASLNQVVDKSLAKPLNQERIFELIVDMYSINVFSALDQQDQDSLSEKTLIHRSAIIETPHIIQESFSDFNGMSLLLVEDNIINQKVLANVLKPSGINISIANNGREAVDMVLKGTEEFDLVLMDINMPVMDGYAATQMIRSKKAFDILPIVAFTALALDSEKQKIFLSGMNAFLTKPLKIGELYTVFKLYVTNISERKKIQYPKIVEQIDALDIEAGIRYSDNNQAFYVEILKEFMDAYGQSSEQFTKLVREHRYEQIKMLCLDMKGLTGAIGATDMHKLINEIHQHIVYNKQELLPNYIGTYQKESQKLNNSIKHYTASVNVPSA